MKKRQWIWHKFRLVAGILTLTYSICGSAFEIQCDVDDFTDEESCRIEKVNMTTGQGITIGHTDDKQSVAFGILDLVDQPLFEEYLLVRVDEFEARDLAQPKNSADGSRGYVLTALSKQEAESFFQEIIDGETLKARLSVFDGAYKDFNFSTSGFGNVWQEFKDKSPLW